MCRMSSGKPFSFKLAEQLQMTPILSDTFSIEGPQKVTSLRVVRRPGVRSGHIDRDDIALVLFLWRAEVKSSVSKL